MLKDIQKPDLRVIFNKYKNISKTSINKCAEIGLPCGAPLSNLKYFVVFPLLMMQNS